MRSKFLVFALLVSSLAVFASLLASAPAEAQLILVIKRYRVVAVEASRSVIRVVPADKEGDDDAGSEVFVGADTRMYVLDHQIPSFSWRLLQRGMKITVQGGLTWDLKVKAKKIYL